MSLIFDFNFLNSQLEKSAKEKSWFSSRRLQCWFIEIWWVEATDDKAADDFHDSLLSNISLPHILQTARIMYHSETVTDNVFPNNISQETVSGSLTAAMSDQVS